MTGAFPPHGANHAWKHYRVVFVSSTESLYPYHNGSEFGWHWRDAIITGIFMAINYPLIYTLGFLYISNSSSANAQLPGCFCNWTFSLNIGLNMFPLDWLLYVMFTFPTRIFYRGVPGFATDCPYGVWCRGLTTCPLYVGPLFGNLYSLKW